MIRVLLADDEALVRDSFRLTHIGRIFTKLDRRDRAQAVVAAYDAGLVRARRFPNSALTMRVRERSGAELASPAPHSSHDRLSA